MTSAFWTKDFEYNFRLFKDKREPDAADPVLGVPPDDSGSD